MVTCEEKEARRV
ncbi:hypothetical protein YPPY96_2740, partial [Yersinia pestis PY-96]